MCSARELCQAGRQTGRLSQQIYVLIDMIRIL